MYIYIYMYIYICIYGLVFRVPTPPNGMGPQVAPRSLLCASYWQHFWSYKILTATVWDHQKLLFFIFFIFIFIFMFIFIIIFIIMFFHFIFIFFILSSFFFHLQLHFFHLQLHFFSFATSCFFHFPLFLMVFHCSSLFFIAFLDFRCHGQGKWKKMKKMIKNDKKNDKTMKISSSFWRFPGSEWESATLSPNFHFFFICNFIFFSFSFVFDGFPLFFMAFLDFRCHGQGKWKKNDKKMIKTW